MVSYSTTDLSLKTDGSETKINNELFNNINNASLETNSSVNGSSNANVLQEKLIQSLGFSMMFIMVIIFNTMGTIIDDRKKQLLARTASFDVNLCEIALGNLLGTLIIGMAIGLSGIITDNLNPSLILATVSFPTCLLCGCLIPQSLMPPFMRSIGYIVPQKWVLLSIGDLLAGSSMYKIFFNLAIVLMFGLAFTTFGVKSLDPWMSKKLLTKITKCFIIN